MTTIAVTFFARGTEAAWYSSCERFLKSYRRCPSGVAHSLYVVANGFDDANSLDEVKGIFSSVLHTLVVLPGKQLDIRSAVDWANQIDEDLMCVLNSSSEILSDDWLRKLEVNLGLPNVGLVGATGSFESLNELDASFPAFPNPYIRSNAFMIERKLFCDITKNSILTSRFDNLLFESGQQSLTRQILSQGQEILVVGRNGRGYSPTWWPTSDTFQHGMQKNLLVADDQTRRFTALRWPEKRELVFNTWGYYIREEEMMSRSPSVFRRELTT